MIHRIVQFALRQRFLVLMATLLIVIAGAWSFRQMPVDAYPDLSPPMVELITQWPGHAAAEVERLTTLPLELAMNGTPHLKVMRSISLYGLSDIRLTFDEGVDPYFARQVVFERIGDATLPQGLTPSMSPLFSPSGLVYRYVVESPDRTPTELHTYDDWIISRAYRSVPGVADDSGFGGPTMEYHVLLDPARLYSYHLPVVQVLHALAANNSNSGGGFFTQGGQFYYVRGLGLLKSTDDIGEVVVGSNNGAPIRVKDVGRVVIGHAPRLGIFGFQDKQKNNDDAVEGVILMRKGEQTQNVLAGVQRKTEELNKSVLPPDIKISLLRPQRPRPRYHGHRRRQSPSRHDPRASRPDLFPRQRPRRRHHRSHHSARPALCLHLPSSNRRSRQSPLHRRHRFRHHHRRHHRHGREHLSRARPPQRSGLQSPRSHPRRRPLRGPPHLLFRRRHHRRLPPHLRPQRTRRKALSSHGGHHGLRAGRRPRLYAHLRAGLGFVLVQARRGGKTQPHLRMDPRQILRPPCVVPRSPENHASRRRSYLRLDASPRPVHRRRISPAPR